MHLAAERYYLASYRLYDIDQNIGAYMRLGVPKDLFACSVTLENTQHLSDPFILYPGVELSVGKCPGSTLAELDI